MQRSPLVKDHALTVAGGTVTNATRVDGRSDLWELTVTSAGAGAVSILVPQGRACTETGALCTADGAMLSPGLAMADEPVSGERRERAAYQAGGVRCSSEASRTAATSRRNGGRSSAARRARSPVRNYEPGDLAVFHRDHYGCQKDDVCTVTGIEDGMVVLAHPDGEERRFRPSGNAAWYLRICDTERIELRAGERIRWTRNRKVPPSRFGHPRTPDLVNGGEAEIVDIDRKRVRFRDPEGRAFNLALADPQLRHLDHAYCSTVHAAQGRTARAAIAVLDAGGTADRELFHVEVSRVDYLAMA